MSNSNPLLANPARIPGETFPLPSGGLFYTNGELASDVVDGEVHVYPMTAYDEILIKTPDLLFNGKAVEQIFNRCIPSILKPMELISKDVDFLLIALRLVSFGPTIGVLHTHGCDGAKEHKYDVSIQDFIQRVKRISSAALIAEYTLSMDTGHIVRLSPMRYHTVVDMMTNLDDDKLLTPDELHKRNSSQIGSLISSVTLPVVDGVDPVVVVDKKHICEWVESLSIKEIKKVHQSIENQRDWGADTHYDVVCKDCGDTVNINVPLNPIHFFTWS